MSLEICEESGQKQEALDDYDAGSDSTTSSSSAASSIGVVEEERASDKNKQLVERRGKLRETSLLAKMLILLKEFVFMLLAVCVYAAMINDTPKVSKSPAAYPFFARDSSVTDWYRGEISAAIEETRKSDLAFVMFYAPWDSKSQDMRSEFETAAKQMSNSVSFAAINCWHPNSECHQQYEKVYNWPVLIAYPTHGRGVQYHGAKTAENIVKFLLAVAKPIIRLNRDESITELFAVYDAVIFAELDCYPGSLDYAVFHAASLRFLEKDPYREVAFAVATTKRDSRPVLKIHMWNEILIYPSDKEWKTDFILAWMYKSLHQVAIWVSPTGSKSQQLSGHVQAKPALILFTPRNVLLPVDYYDMFKSVALNYNNCDNQSGVNAIQDALNRKRQDNYANYNNMVDNCSRRLDVKVPSVVSISKAWPNNSCNSNSNSCNKLHVDADSTLRTSEICKRLRTGALCSSRSQNANCDNDDQQEHLMKTSMLSDASDRRSMTNLRKLQESSKCALFEWARSLQKPIFERSRLIKNPAINITGLGCLANLTLSFVAMDSRKYHHFAERFSIDLSNKHDGSAAIILNEKMETHHVLTHINSYSLMEFIYNFTQDQIPRAFSGNSAQFPRTHVYPLARNCSDFDGKSRCVEELDSRTYLPTVLENGKAVLVFYHSKQCSFCNGISYVFLKVAHLLSKVDNLVFARIDGELNDLPWEYTMEAYPTILYFPPIKKSESRAFPSDVETSVPNLLRFLLINMEPAMKLQCMWTLCKDIKYKIEKNACVSTIRMEILSFINKHLKLWRNGDARERREHLYKLQQLRNLHLTFAHAPNDISNIRVYLTKLNNRNSIVGSLNVGKSKAKRTDEL